MLLKTTGLFELAYFPIKVNNSGETFYLIPFGDIHRSAPLCHVEKWIEFLEWAKGKNNAYFIGMGDYDDLLSASERSILEKAELHESSKETIDSMYKEHTKRLAKELSFMRGRIIGLIEGNHYATLKECITTTQYLCQQLDCKYLGSSTFVRMAFQYKDTRKALSLDIWAHHGKGAARLIGGSLNRVQQMAEAANADIYIMGHDHKKSAGTCSKLVLSGQGENMVLRHKKQLFIRSGSFLKGYEPGKVSYVADAAMNPTDLGVVKIEITPKQSNGNYTLDIHASI